MQSKTQIILNKLEELFAKKIDPFIFSIDFPSIVYNFYFELEEEHNGLGDYLDQVTNAICDEGEPGFDPTHMIEELKKVYQKVLEFIEN